MPKTFLRTRIFNYYNDRMADLLTYRTRKDKEEFDRLNAYLDRCLANKPELAVWLETNPQFDHRKITF